MLEWEYKIIDSHEVPRQGVLKGNSKKVLEDYLNDLGRQGWEFIKIDFRDGLGISFVAIAKREKLRIIQRRKIFRIK